MPEWRREEWEQVDRLFAAALELPADQRETFLDASDAAPDIVARVRRLLDHEEKAPDRIAESAEQLAADLITSGSVEHSTSPEEDAELPPGAEIGPYRVVDELGRGGMGTVYLAERADGQYERRVAIKVIKRGMDTDEILARFRREGRILSRLEHPSIARMYEADVTDDGRPYLVLEYVEGEGIDTHCDARRLSVDARVRLFLDVCAAVSHAHAKLILHRDIKPSNILVTDEGPKLLDFGVGMILDDDAATGALTERVGRRLTPAYASPEQIAGDPISTTSDVYSLGVVLFELLTGTRPERGEARRASVVVTGATETEDTTTIAASRGSTPVRLGRRLRGDLDLILLKALHDDTDRRYPSVEAFAEDLRRHLLGFPVTARPDSVTYRVRKFVRRNRLPVLSGSGLGVLLVAFAIASAVQEARTARERDRADVERVRAEAVASVLERMFTGADFNTADRIDTLTVRQFVERSATEVLEGLDDQPVVQGTLMRILGSSQLRLGNVEQADSLLTESVTVLESADPPDPRELDAARRDLAQLRERQGRFDEARAIYGALLESATGGGPERAEAYHNYAVAVFSSGDFETGAVFLDSAIAIHRSLESPRAADLAASLTMRAGIAQRMGDLPASVELSREAWEVFSEELGPDHPSVLTVAHNYAFMLFRSGEVDRALPMFEDLVTRARSLGSIPDFPTALNNYGNALRESGRAEESIPLIEESIGVTRERYGTVHPDLTFAYDALGTTYDVLERYDEALAAFQNGLAVAEAVFPPGHPSRAVLMGKVAHATCVAGQPLGEVDARFAGAAEAIRGAFPSDHPRVAELVIRQGSCFLRSDRAEEAVPLLEQAIAATEALDRPPPQLSRLRELLEEARAAAR